MTETAVAWQEMEEPILLGVANTLKAQEDG